MRESRLIRRAILIVVVSVLVPASGAAQTPLGSYTDHEVGPSSVTVWADTSGMRLTWYRRDVVRVDVLPSPSTTRDSSLAVHREPTGVAINAYADAKAVHVSTPGLTAHIQKNPVRLRIEGAGEQTLLREAASAGMVADGERRRTQFRLPSDLRFYGTGERGLDLNLRGERFQSYNEQHFGYTQPPPTMNINVPLLLTSRGYALLFDDPHPGTFDLGVEDPSKFWYEADGGQLSYFVLAGTSIPEQLQTYTWLTGRPPMPPKWTLGYLQSKYGYRTADAARQTVDRFREENIPADGLILDLYWFEHMGDFSWDPSAFPNPTQMIDDFEAKGIKTIVITEPYVTETSNWFADMVGEGVPRPAQTQNGTPYRLGGWWSCGCDAVLADVTHAPTRNWWRARYKDVLSSGVHGLWTDLGEPEAHPAPMQHAAGPADAVHNVYNLLWARTVQNAFREQRPDQRLVNLTRSGYAGIQRYGVFTWSADVGRTFDGLAAQRSLMLNSSLSGLYYHSSDLGGFVGQTSPELYARWLQMGAFTPVMRPHGIDNQPTEPWGFGASVLDISREYVQLRYRLLPYLYTMAYRAHDRGMPIVRPLFFEEPDASSLAEEEDAYLFGDSFLVAPVVTAGKREKTVPLPDGTWINYWTDQAVTGGASVTVDAPLDRLPLFVRAGSIVPMRPTAPDHIGHSVADTLQLAVYPQDEASQFRFYEDDGHTRAYEQGRYATTIFRQRRTTRNGNTRMTVTMGATQGSFEGLPARRTYHVVLHRTAEPPRRVTFDGRVLYDRGSPTALRENQSGFAYDATTERLHVRASGAVQMEHQLHASVGDGPIAVQSALVSSDRPVDFGSTGVRLAMSGVQGQDTVTVARRVRSPALPDSLDGGRAGADRLVLTAGDELGFGTATLRVAAEALGGVDNPSQVTLYRRTEPGTGSFSALTTRLEDNGTPDDASDDTLSATTDALGEFVPVVRPAPASALELERFEAAVEDQTVALTWRGPAPVRPGYHVQRTRNGRSWTSVGTVTVPTNARTYRFTDEEVPYAADSLGYRLKEIRTDGREARYSQTLTVDRRVEAVELQEIAPNPTRQRATVRYALPEQQAMAMRLYDVLGRRVRTVLDRTQTGRHERQIDVSGLPSGTYFLRLRAGDTIATERLTVVR